ncbi:hypothetical protein DPMN_128144 [Dreissena polymorpha]|uniref:Uncharacterized protein n=1 Tax=Dreissena polymorpha TaxID=45954 RepID=A0A9D4JZV4_DREPO|nr:hypothetical protein DPMN_128144 [Dreissena polymorpha]
MISDFAEAWAKHCTCIGSVKHLGLRTAYESKGGVNKLLCKTFASPLLPPAYIQAALNNPGKRQASNKTHI